MKRNFIISLTAIMCLLFATGTFAAGLAISDSSGQSLIAINSVEGKTSGGGVPVGSVIEWPHAGYPDGPDDYVIINNVAYPKWLECNGQTINAAVYPELAAMYGARVPDHRGLFKRGYGAQTFNVGGFGNVNHASGVFGQIQGDAVRPITGGKTGLVIPSSIWASGPTSGAFQSYGQTGYGVSGYQAGTAYIPVYFNPSAAGPTADENRPVNTATRYLMRAMR